MSNNTIHVEVKDTYQRRFYPMCQTAQIFAAIAGTVTLTDVVLKQIAQLGYKISYTMHCDLPTTNSKDM